MSSNRPTMNSDKIESIGVSFFFFWFIFLSFLLGGGGGVYTVSNNTLN